MQCPLGNGGYLYCGAGRVFHVNKSVSFLLQFIHLALVGQQAVVLEVLMEIKSKRRYLRVWSPLKISHVNSIFSCGVGYSHM